VELNILPVIETARIPQDLPYVRALFQEYADSLAFDLDFQDFQSELDGLPGHYAAPEGTLLVAWDAHAPGHCLGCVAIRPLDTSGTCEGKRLYVRSEARGTGLGRSLAEAAIQEARRLGYRFLRLDSSPSMKEAIGLYHSLGFVPIEPYCFNPLEGALYMELAL